MSEHAAENDVDQCACNDDGYHHRPGCPVVGGVDLTTGETHREVWSEKAAALTSVEPDCREEWKP